MCIRDRVLCELFEEFVYSSVAYNEEEHSYDFTGEMSYNVKEVIIVCGPYLSEVPYFVMVGDVRRTRSDKIIEKFGGIAAIKSLIKKEILDRKSRCAPFLSKKMYEKPEYFVERLVHPKLESTPLLFTNCSGYETAALQLYLQSVYGHLQANDANANCQTLQYALGKTYMTVDFHLGIRRHIKPAKKNVYEIVAKACYSGIMDQEIQRYLISIFKKNSMDIVWESELIPCGEIFHENVYITMEEAEGEIHYPGFEEAYIYGKIKDCDLTVLEYLPKYLDTWSKQQSVATNASLRRRKTAIN